MELALRNAQDFVLSLWLWLPVLVWCATGCSPRGNVAGITSPFFAFIILWDCTAGGDCIFARPRIFDDIFKIMLIKKVKLLGMSSNGEQQRKCDGPKMN